MDKKFIDILQQLVKDLNTDNKIDKFLAKSTCKSYLDDYTKGEFKTEKKFLLRVLEEDVAKEIYNTTDLPNCKKKQVRVLVEAINPEDASIEIVDILAFLLRGDTTKTVKQKEKKEEPPVKQPTVQPVQNGTIIDKPKEKSIITFGAYQWLVLEVQNNKALLLSKDIIEERQYHETYKDITWEKCDLRAYLNGQFFNSNSFTNADRARILQVNNYNENNQWFGTKGGAITNDKIFLLSLAEVVKYFGDSGQLAKRPKSNPWYIDDKYNSERIAQYNGSACFWWLRSPGRNGGDASDVLGGGGLDFSGYGVYGASGGVRPALWLNL